MKGFRIIVAAALVLALCAGGALAADKDWPSSLQFVAGPPGGSWFPMGGAVADVITKNVEGVSCTSGTGGGVSNIFNVNRKKADLGLTVVFMGKPSMNGKEIFEKHGRQDNVSVLTNVYKQYFYFIVRSEWAEKNGVETIQDIFDQELDFRMATLKPGTSSEYMVRRTLEAGYGVSYDDIKSWGGSVEYSSYSDGANLMADKHLDAFAFTVSLPASIIMKMETQTDIDILPVDPKALKAMSEAYGTATFTIQPSDYECVDEPVKTVGSYTSILVRKDLPEGLVYEIAKAVFNHKKTLADTVSAMKQLNLKDGPQNTVFPLHPGAAKYFKEQGTL
ncbi:MAG: TAXI family TRAP transporter solute-binding subunit [Synergistales bacterium]|nr:TAXI family TRAP transporter solute-binding subunit [Synergistales bacterium]